MAPEKWLLKNDAQAVEDLFGALGREPLAVHFGLHRAASSAFRQAMLVPGVAHSALEYYRWAFRAQFRGEGRRFTDAVGARIAAPTLQLHGADDTCILPETATSSTRWAGPHAEPEDLAGRRALPPPRSAGPHVGGPGGLPQPSVMAFFARSTDSSAGPPVGFSVASAWLSATNGRIRRS